MICLESLLHPTPAHERHVVVKPGDPRQDLPVRRPMVTPPRRGTFSFPGTRSGLSVVLRKGPERGVTVLGGDEIKGN